MKNVDEKKIHLFMEKTINLDLTKILKSLASEFKIEFLGRNNLKIDVILIDFNKANFEETLREVSFLKETNKPIYLLNCPDREEIKFELLTKGVNLVQDNSQLHNNLKMIFRKTLLRKKWAFFESSYRKNFFVLDERMIPSLKEAINGSVLDIPILLRGESGTGKTLLAKLIAGHIKEEENLVQISCSNLSDDLFESELFGFKKGSFTGAAYEKKGKILSAHNGFLFLDEIAALSFSAQSKFLKVLEEKIFYQIGSNSPTKCNFKLISATCEDLEKMVKKGTFRIDLYHRISGKELWLEPLRNSKNRIDSLLKSFIKKRGQYMTLEKGVVEFLKNYKWPGNYRELKNLIDIWSINDLRVVKQKHLPMKFFKNNSGERSDHPLSSNLDDLPIHGLRRYLKKLEKSLLLESFNKNEHNVRKTIEELKISCSSFYRILLN